MNETCHLTQIQRQAACDKGRTMSRKSGSVGTSVAPPTSKRSGQLEGSHFPGWVDRNMVDISGPPNGQFGNNWAFYEVQNAIDRLGSFVFSNGVPRTIVGCSETLMIGTRAQVFGRPRSCLSRIRFTRDQPKPSELSQRQTCHCGHVAFGIPASSGTAHVVSHTSDVRSARRFGIRESPSESPGKHFDVLR